MCRVDLVLKNGDQHFANEFWPGSGQIFHFPMGKMLIVVYKSDINTNNPYFVLIAHARSKINTRGPREDLRGPCEEANRVDPSRTRENQHEAAAQIEQLRDNRDNAFFLMLSINPAPFRRMSHRSAMFCRSSRSYPCSRSWTGDLQWKSRPYLWNML